MVQNPPPPRAFLITAGASPRSAEPTAAFSQPRGCTLYPLRDAGHVLRAGRGESGPGLDPSISAWGHGERLSQQLAGGWFLSDPHPLCWVLNGQGKAFFMLSVCLCVLSHVWLFMTPWTVACQDPLSMGFFHARILEWAAISCSRVSSWPRDRTCSPESSGLSLLHWQVNCLSLAPLGKPILLRYWGYLLKHLTNLDYRLNFIPILHSISCTHNQLANNASLTFSFIY